MTIPVPFPVQPGDKLTVTVDNACGTDLKSGDLVTVLDVSVHVTDGLPVPVVQVSTAHGVQMLTFNVVTRVSPDALAYTPAESDDVVDAFFFRIIGNDDDLRDWAVKARTELAAHDPQPAEEAAGGGTAVAERRAVGQVYKYEDADGDQVEVTYYEQECPNHGREGAFHFVINDEAAVVLPVAHMDPLLRFLVTMRNHSRRDGE